MRICPICERRKVRRRYYYCDSCYRQHYDDIKKHEPWVKELFSMFRKSEYLESKIRQHEILLDDYNLVVGDDGEIYYDQEFLD